jgi:serine/threonine-protein kinase
VTPEEWRRIKQLFQDLLDLPVGDRAARLDQLDAATRREVETLLEAATAGTDGFLEAPPFDRPRDETIGRRIGSWRIDEELGRGGMGAVYLATRVDDELRGQVALKVVKRGMDTDFVLRRFRAERQILAELSHPNIARLLDAGTTDDGTPWFAMESASHPRWWSRTTRTRPSR